MEGQIMPISPNEQYLREYKVYNGMSDWQAKGITGKGIKVWQFEGRTWHGQEVANMIMAGAPGADIIYGAFSAGANQNGYTNTTITTMADTYVRTEDYLRDERPDIITSSIGLNKFAQRDSKRYQGITEFWKDLQKMYKHVHCCSAGNEDAKGIVNEIPEFVGIYIGAASLIKGKVRVASYSSYSDVGGVDFCNFTGPNSGTSFASPFTAGMVAMLMQRYGKMEQEEVYKYLKFIAEDVDTEGQDAKTGWGLPRLRAYDKKYITLSIDNFTFFVNGIRNQLDSAPVLTPEGRTLVPIRFISEALGAFIDWTVNHDKSIEVVVRTDKKEIVLTTGSNVLFVNGKKEYMDVAPIIIKDRTMVPIRFIAENLNCDVDWIQSEKKVMILQK
jgi:hypothetical protein